MCKGMEIIETIERQNQKVIYRIVIKVVGQTFVRQGMAKENFKSGKN